MDESSLVKWTDIFVGSDHHDMKGMRGACTQGCNRIYLL